jgi:short-subunit dehydrogenase
MKQNESVIVTASSKGLGKAIAIAFAKKGYDIILNARDESRLKEVELELKEKFPDLSFVSVLGDIRNKEVLDLFLDNAKKMNTTVLVNNAAIPSKGLSFEQLDDAYIDENININLIAQIKLSLRLYKWFIENKKGCIININSIVGIEPKEIHNVHSGAKWGLKGFSECLRLEAKKHNIRVMSVFPTRIRTV